MPYFDYNATAPLSPEALVAWQLASKIYWANPSALYRHGVEAYEALMAARLWVAGQVGASLDQIVFTSGATENAHSAFALAARNGGSLSWVAISALEHPCVRAAAERYFPGRVYLLPLNASGVVCFDVLERALGEKTFSLVAIMAASNEIGTLQPWKEAHVICKKNRVPLLVDAVQWTGRLPSWDLGGCDFVSISSHKLGGPRGVGVLKIPESAEGGLLMDGGGQEANYRAGTENVPSILGFVAAWKAVEAVRERVALEQGAFRDQFVAALKDSIPGVELLGEAAPRLWNTATLLMPLHAGTRWVKRLDKLGFEVGTGAACANDGGKALSLRALGLDEEASQRIVRVSGGPQTLQSEWAALATAFKLVRQKLEA